MPIALVQFVLLYVPLVLTFHAFVALLVFGERSHQLVAETGYTLIQNGLSPVCTLTVIYDSLYHFSNEFLLPLELRLLFFFD
jgi:hypothetical protein